MRPIFALVLVTLVSGCIERPPEEAIRFSSDEPRYRNLDPSVGYVGIDACVKCHPAKSATYIESQMGRSFKPATRSASDADWRDVEPIYDPFVDFYYRPYAVGESLYVMEFRLAMGDTVHKRIEKIDYIVGSGHHTNSHMMDVNGYLYQMPATWYVQEARWDLPPGFDEGHNWRFERAIEIECMTCHNAMPEYVEGSDNRYVDLPHGIDCERCHGPGSLHVAEKKAGKVVNTAKEIDSTIVNPAKLPLDLQFDVCQRCHLQGVAVPVEGFSFTDFRPGMRLGDVINVYFPRYTDSLSKFIMASHPDRLRMSECRMPSTLTPGTMDPLPCIACHDPHVPIETLGRDAYNRACLDCHGATSDPSSAPPSATRPASPEQAVGRQTSEAENPVSEVSVSGCTEDITVRAARDDDCSGCHMPVVESLDIPHVRITDHNIRILDQDRSVQADTIVTPPKRKEFVRLATLTSSRPTHKMIGEGYLAYYEQFNNVQRFLDSAAVYLNKARKSTTDRSLARALVRLWYLEERYDEIARFADEEDPRDLEHHWTLYRIGEAYSKIGRHADAKEYYGRAVDRGPDHLWFRTKLASAHVALQDPISAVAILDDVLRDNPKFHHAYNNRGYAHLLAGNYAEAEADFLKTLDLDPDTKPALANLASFYFNTGEPERARPLVDRLLQLDPENEQYREFDRAVQAALEK